jgi:hypothetical protein
MRSGLIWCGVAAAMALQLAACNGSSPLVIPNAAQATPSVQTAQAVVGGDSQSISIVFASSDTQPISNLSVGGLANLPSGWSGPASFGCASVMSGSGCVLNLTFAPSTGGTGTLSLMYSYTNSVDRTLSGTVAIPYSATANDVVNATVGPTPPVTALAGSGSQNVLVTFMTSDGLAASNLTLTSSLSSLPSGWSSTSNSFSCATVSTGNVCQLALTFTPQTAGSGTLTLNYGYTDNAGNAASGSVNIPYAGTTDDTVAGTISPTGQITAPQNGNTAVSVTFATSDGQPAANLTITGGLSSLPSDWSGPASFSCSTVSDGTTCELSLTYAPTSVDSGTVALTYQYVNDAGDDETGSVNISYATATPHLYVANLFSTLDECVLGAGGSLTSCAATPSSGGSSSPAGIAFNGNNVYVTDFYAGEVWLCAVNADGSFSSCAIAASGLTAPWALAISGSYLYITSDSTLGTTTYCQIGTGGALSNCAATASGTNLVNGVAVGGGYAYLTALNPAETGYVVDVCTVNSDGSLTGCTSTGSGFSDPQFVTLSGGYAYIGNQQSSSVAVCTIGSGGALTSCANSSVGSEPNGVAIYGSNAYVSDDDDNIYECTLASGGSSLTGCAVSDGGATFNAPQQLAIH